MNTRMSRLKILGMLSGISLLALPAVGATITYKTDTTLQVLPSGAIFHYSGVEGSLDTLPDYGITTIDFGAISVSVPDEVSQRSYFDTFYLPATLNGHFAYIPVNTVVRYPSVDFGWLVSLNLSYAFSGNVLSFTTEEKADGSIFPITTQIQTVPEPNFAVVLGTIGTGLVLFSLFRKKHSPSFKG